VKRLDTIVGVLTRELGSSRIVESLETTLLPEMDLDIMELALSIDELEGVTRVTVHVVVAIRSSTVREEDHNLVNGLGVQGEIVPKHVRVLEVSLRVTLLGVDEVGEFCGVTDEEDCIESAQITRRSLR
jgi:hypothetical protein